MALSPDGCRPTYRLHASVALIASPPPRSGRQYANAQSTDPRDKIFALLGLVRREEQRFLLRSFPNYNLSIEQTNAITLAHVPIFAGSQPLEPIFRALRIPRGRHRNRLLQILGMMDYVDADDPAGDVGYISDSLSVHVDDDSEALVEGYEVDDAVTSDMARNWNLRGIVRGIGGAVVGITSLAVLVIRLWR